MIKYRTAADFEKVQKKEGQVFDKYKPQYFLNEVTDSLERLPNDKDMQEFIDSQKDIALNTVLDRFLNNSFESEDTEAIADYTSQKVDLSVLGGAMEIAEDYREKNGLADTMSYREIYAHMNNNAVILENKLKEKLGNVEKKETQSQSESQTVHKDGEENA